MSYSMHFHLQPKQTQNLKQNQLLMMLPQMQQAIMLLQAPVMELEQIIAVEMEKNPVLEYLEEEGEPQEKSEEDPQKLVMDDKDFEVFKKLDEEYSDFFAQSSSPPIKNSDELMMNPLEQTIQSKESLFEHLMQQAKEVFENPKDLKVAEWIIGSLDARGFLQGELKEIATLAGTNEEMLTPILEEIQKLDPSGIGAKDTRETLLIQLRQLNKKNTLAYQIVELCYEDLLHNRLPLIAKACNTSLQRVQKGIEEDILKLDLRPGLSYEIRHIPFIQADAEIRQEGQELKIWINDDCLPSLKINQQYLQMLEEKELEKDTKQYINHHVLAARWLMKNIHQRHETLRRVLEVIVEKQKPFFTEDNGKLTPMTMMEVAVVLDLHESTVARAVANKSIETPQGLLPMRSFFTHGYVTEEGEDISSKTVQDSLQKLIGGEDPKHPLSDEKLSKKLNEIGIPCARRTIAKYRRLLNIGNASQRRKYR